MAKKKKKKAAKKKSVGSSKKKKTNITKKTNIANKTNNSSKNNSGSKKTNIQASNKKKQSVKKSVEDKKVKSNKIDIKNKRKINIKVLVISSVLLLLCILVIVFLNNNRNNKVSTDGFVSINFDEYLDLYEKEGLEFIYLYHSSCINCTSYEEKLIKLEKELEIKLKKFDYSKLNDSDMSILKSSNIFLEDKIEIPMIISIKDGNEISSISGIKEYSALKNFVNLSKNETGINKFAKIDVGQYLSILNSKDKNVIYICDSSDACNKFSSVLDSVSSDKKIKINYLNTENITSSEDWENLESSSKIFDGMWFMPVIMVVKDNKVIDYKMETLSEKDLKSFFKRNGM